MIPQDLDTFHEVIRRSQEACDALSEAEDGLKREILAHAGNRWSLGVVHALGVAGTLRHAELARRLEGVTQRMLTRTLRQLERDGLISRRDHREVPPRVDYTLTELGRGLLQGMIPLWTWVIDNADAFRAARDRFDTDGGHGDDVPARTRSVASPVPRS
ncbi:winged helix-turn-helix transcriptional regulator [Rhodovastum atsumiense]|uniref:winged helix-turn-helix transcriptional regulator n=1 Tax=Rhodovastum atsumiense TaxID=504468 RepID=UPI001EF0D252|nr:helix-turn-helix domain-containing protein [Rhodovastum atsumiense]